MLKEDVISLFGSASELARVAGISRGTVSGWPEKLEGRVANEMLGLVITERGLAKARAFWPEKFGEK